MGCWQSKVTNDVIPSSPDIYEYNGEPVVYEYINTDVHIKIKKKFGRKTRLTTNISNNYSELEQMYSNGYRLLDFVPLPGQAKVQAAQHNQIFQAIFYSDPPDKYDESFPEKEGWDLQVVQANMVYKFVVSGVLRKEITASSDISNVLERVNQMANLGARFVGLVRTKATFKREGFMHMFNGDFSVDLFFEMPRFKNKPSYLYEAATVTGAVYLTSNCFGTRVYHTDCDWKSTVNNYINRGWRLITAFVDNNQLVYDNQLTSCNTTFNCVWMFERPSDAPNDNIPVYEYKMVEFPYGLTPVCGGVRANTLWDATIDDMGSRGWHLACVLETPEAYSSSTLTVKVLLYFQRKLPV